MKKTICIFLSILFIVALIPLSAFAADDTPGLENIATKGIAYSSSEKNSLWTPPKSINDGVYDWHGWECRYPEINSGTDTSNGFSGEYCGIKFVNHEYYEIYELKMHIGLHAMCGGQNAKYTIEALVEGEWIKISELKDEQATDIVKGDGTYYESYADAMKNDTSNYHIGADLYARFEKPVTTNNIRITVSEYAKNYPGGDILIFPYIYEVEVMGKIGETPEVELPEGAVPSTNIAHNSFAYASSSADGLYPYLAIDGKNNTSWAPKDIKVGAYLAVEFSKEYTVDKIVLNFGDYEASANRKNYKFDIEACIDGKWTKIADGSSLDEEKKTLITEYEITPTQMSGVRIVFTEVPNGRPRVYELEAHITGEKTYYSDMRFDRDKLNSVSKGNLAISGEAYASVDFPPYSDVSYINDGKASEDAYVWFTGTLVVPAYCGVKLDRKYNVDKVAVYVKAPDVEGTDVMHFEVQALVDGEYVTVAEGRSYSKETKYTTVYTFDAVETDDIRIYFTRGGGTIVNLRELEIYSGDNPNPMFDGIRRTEGAFAAAKTSVYASHPESAEPKGVQSEKNFQMAAVIISAVAASCLSGAVMAVLFCRNKKRR